MTRRPGEGMLNEGPVTATDHLIIVSVVADVNKI